MFDLLLLPVAALLIMFGVNLTVATPVEQSRRTRIVFTTLALLVITVALGIVAYVAA